MPPPNPLLHLADAGVYLVLIVVAFFDLKTAFIVLLTLEMATRLCRFIPAVLAPLIEDRLKRKQTDEVS